MEVVRRLQDGSVSYTARSAGFGRRAAWLHTHTDGTLARALRGMQEHYARTAATYLSHVSDMEQGRRSSVVSGGRPKP